MIQRAIVTAISPVRVRLPGASTDSPVVVLNPGVITYAVSNIVAVAQYDGRKLLLLGKV